MGVIINQFINKRKSEETLSFLIWLICPFIHLTCVNILRAYYMPGTDLGAGETERNKDRWKVLSSWSCPASEDSRR